MEAADIVRTVREVVEAAPDEIIAVYLYGSRGRGDAKPTSDVDLGVLLKSRPPSTLSNVVSDLEGAVERAVGLPVEAVAMNGASPDLVHRVMRDGIIILDRDRPARLEFEVQARNEYFDMEPIRRLYRRLPPA
jgi:predicted nucleotidyltransferase